jgi:hypothetical protein
MKQLLLNIQDRLNTECSFLKFIDFDEGQLDYYAERPPVDFPCVLLDYVSGDFTNTAGYKQQGIGMIVITIADIKLTNSSAKAPQVQKDAALKILDYKENIHHYLHGWNPFAGHGKLIRTNERKQQRDDSIKVWKITYSIGLNNI